MRGMRSEPAPVAIVFAGLVCESFALAEGTREPNDIPEQAAAVAIGEPFEFTLDPAEDRDLFRLEAPEAGFFTATVLATPEAHEPFLWWIRADGEEVRARERDIRIAKAESVILAVRSQDGVLDSQASPDPVRMRVDFTPEPFPSEPNDSLDTASALEVGVEVTLVLAPRLDRDLFRIDPPADGFLHVSVLETPCS